MQFVCVSISVIIETRCHLIVKQIAAAHFSILKRMLELGFPQTIEPLIIKSACEMQNRKMKKMLNKHLEYYS